MRKVMLAGVMLLLGASASAENLYYGSRAGMEVTVVSKSDLGTIHAKIVTKHTRENAAVYCREYVGKVTPSCIASELQTSLSPTIQANCETGKFTTLDSERFQFAGVNPKFDPTDSDENPEYLIMKVGENEQLRGYEATGYGTALDQFKALCPNRVH
jgi:hypothetical protein